MKVYAKKVLLFFIVGSIVLAVIYRSEIINLFFNDNVYIVFDIEKDVDKELNWSKYSQLFPKNFNPKNTLVNIGELQKLNKEQRLKFDSIKNNFYKYPYKILTLENNERIYSISINPNLRVKLKSVNRKRIELHTLKSLNILSLDSLIQIIPDLEYLQLKNRNNSIKMIENVRFNVIELDKNKATSIEVEPIVIEYN